MEREVQEYISYLHNVKHTSNNTEMSYKRDLLKVCHFMQERGINSATAVKEQDLKAYIHALEEQKLAAATVSRNIASIKAFFLYLFSEGKIQNDAALCLKAPKIEKKMPEILTMGVKCRRFLSRRMATVRRKSGIKRCWSFCMQQASV